MFRAFDATRTLNVSPTLHKARLEITKGRGTNTATQRYQREIYPHTKKLGLFYTEEMEATTEMQCDARA